IYVGLLAIHAEQAFVALQAGLVAYMPFLIVIPMLDPASPGIFVPRYHLVRVEEVIPVRKGTDSQTNLLAVKVIVRIMRNLQAMLSYREREVCTEEPGMNRVG